ncbi:NAD-dependent epimerase/dehydratase family protein [Eupransor demetentiae]|uniref:Nucleoside-diphosphate-sugar epimerase (WcaG) n=1 Tax=Eupransor demetentiae TaxID=3109584 RepID=A0ABM9N4B3_9LACO|nr:Nucleoside-diphosphate-sugar epimerase (WcaG) [Lactobacillaceae bacterium LMG 33000]
MENLLLTGVTGLLGQAFVAQLAKKYKITGIGRNQEIGRKLESQYGIHFIAMDLGDMTPADRQLLADTKPDVIVHAAARSEYWGSKQEFYQANVMGTENMLAVGQLAGVERFIQISSPSIYFHYEKAEMATEDYPIPSHFANEYARTKYLADKAVMASHLNYIILRPRAIFGPNDQTIVKPLLDRNAHGGIPLPNYGKKQWIDVTNVANVVHAIDLAIQTTNPAALNQAYNITNGQPAQMYALLKDLTQQLGQPLKIKPIPYWLLYSVGFLSEKIYHIFHLKGAPLLTRYVASVLGHSQTLSIKKAQTLLNYQPIESTEEGIEEYVHAQQN